MYPECHGRLRKRALELLHDFPLSGAGLGGVASSFRGASHTAFADEVDERGDVVPILGERPLYKQTGQAANEQLNGDPGIGWYSLEVFSPDSSNRLNERALVSSTGRSGDSP